MATQTTVGSLLVNEYLPPSARDYTKVVDKKQMLNMLGDVAKNYPQHYATVTKALKDLGDNHSYLEGSSFTFEDVKPVKVDHIFKKYEPALAEARKVKDQKQREKQMQTVNLQIEHEINQLVDTDMKTKQNAVFDWSTIGGKGNRNNMRQMFYASGNQLDVTNKMLPFMAKNSFAKGLSPSDAFISATGARKGVVESFISVKDPGALAKEFFMLTNSMITTEEDCGSPDGLKMSIDSPEIYDRYLAKPVGVYHRNDLVDSLVKHGLKKAGISMVEVRSPLTCHAKEGVCQKCVGILENGKVSPIGDTVGLRSSQALTEKLTQMALSSKHTGGVVGKKSAFETVKQLLHVPENFPNAAVLAQHAGTIDHIEKTSDGGSKIWINNKYHYVEPQQKILVKPGQKVDVAHQLAEGLINPAEIVRLKGMDAGRLHLARALQDTYQNMGGISGQAKVFETVSRAILNLGEVQDPGDHEDYEIGDKIKWNVAQQKMKKEHAVLHPAEAVGWRSVKDLPAFKIKAGDHITPEHVDKLVHFTSGLEVYKNPLKVQPIMYGTERAAVYGGDWLSNLGFRFVKDRLKENIVTGAKVDIHGHNPIASYVIGSEMGYNQNGKF